MALRAGCCGEAKPGGEPLTNEAAAMHGGAA
jgi:hypothetical protein